MNWFQDDNSKPNLNAVGLAATLTATRSTTKSTVTNPRLENHSKDHFSKCKHQATEMIKPNSILKPNFNSNLKPSSRQNLNSQNNLFNFMKKTISCSSGYSLLIITWFMCLLILFPSSLCTSHPMTSLNSGIEASNGIEASYSTPNLTINFTHLAIDPRSGIIYVGASNWLYQFNGSSLSIQYQVEIGPVNDSPLCSPSDCSSVDQGSITQRNNINKVLVIDEQANKLIACGTVHQGSCRRHNLNGINTHEELIPLPVAANDENSSTLAFIGPSRYYGSKITPVLYVAATNSRLGPYRDMVPAIASRSLDKFSIIEKSFSDQAKVDIEFHMKDYYLVNYIYGFHHHDYIYFANVQKKSHLRALEEWGYVTRLARICQSDAAYNTYTEVTLECIGPDGTDYQLLQDAHVVNAGEDLALDLHIPTGEQVLIGIFATSIDHTAHASTRSAICVYALNDIEMKFTQNIHMCYNGSVATRNMDYIAGNLPDCPTLGRGGNIISFCSETLKLNGSQPIVTGAAKTYENTTLTAVNALTTGHHTVAFVGTSNGYLKKILLTRSDLAEEFEQVKIDEGNPILADLLIDPTKKYIYAASPYKITKVAIERCGQHVGCRECLQARNPYCGWCTLEKRCTLVRECQATRTPSSKFSTSLSSTSSSHSSRWLSLDTQQCIDFQSIKPQSLPITSTEKVELVINQLPQLPHGANYLCVFGEGSAIEAQLTPRGLICRTPPVSWRPQTPAGSDHVMVDLSVRSSETKTDFLHRQFAFYDCSSHKTCMDCVQSQWGCRWCQQENICSHNSSSCSSSNSNSVFKNSKSFPSSTSSSAIKNLQFCPSFDLDHDIIIPNGYPKEIILPVKNLPNANANFRCVVEIEGNKVQVGARVEDNKIICSETAYFYRNEIGTQIGSLTVMWNGDTFIDRANVTLYKCNLLGSHNSRPDCSLCLTLNPRYECSWCSSGCSYTHSCGPQDRVTSCPPPRIDWIHPLSGPIQGGTLVTIEGSNLGTSLEEIQNRITIGGQPCVPANYSVSVRVTCKTAPAQGVSPLIADVVVGNRAGVTQARDKFRYEIVDLTSIHPKIGPQSGGTRIYLSGTNLNIGHDLEVFLDSIPCIVDKTLASSSQISCRTTASSQEYQVKKLLLRIDNANLILENPFEYVADPTILRIYPLKSYLSGGRTVTVLGTNLDAIQQPRLAIFGSDGSVLNESACEVLSSTHMVCLSPPVNPELMDLLYREQLDSPLQTSDPTEYDIKLRIGFLMDAVSSVKELASNFPTVHSDLGYVPDPKFYPFDGMNENGIKLYKGESLVIEGINLRLASTESEVNVTIGTRTCNLTSLATTQLVCMPPEVQPPGTDEIGRRTPTGLPMVVVRVGSTLRYEVGYLQYEMVKSNELPPIAIVAITISSLILILFVLISLAIMKHKSSQAEREYKRIQMQMDTLENSVRSECKQAFAELQTDMTDLTNDLESQGIPVLDHRNYVMKVFFPGINDHPLYQGAPRIRMNGIGINGGAAYDIYELAMGQFEQLLYNKSFIITFINTLESQKTFSIRDRVNVASLIMIILMERMEYATEILKTLLYQLVDKSFASKHPQLMLRRTESVVEKMLTNWLALSMYDYMKDQAGSSLFLLFSALKRQVEKGPIDAVTHDARYSISEERLLREHYCDFEQIMIQVYQENQDEKILCRVNDRDTITQVKAKLLDALYKNTPFSLRPSVHDVDLEWRHGRGGHLTLADEDLTTKIENGCLRINTLRHYGVKNWAVMSLMMRHSNDSYISTLTRNSLSPIMSLSKHFDDHSERYWHLVKPNDDCHQDLLHKAIPEIFLTRLLATKGTVQKFVDDFFMTILSANESLPTAIKWIFDLLDDAAMRHGISDPEVIHAWKSNCLPLRFWVNFIKNPDFILDINKTQTLDSCLSVIAQTLMDSCSTSEHRLGKDSPSNKLLFAKDIPNYRRMVSQFYKDISSLRSVNEQELSSTMQCLSLTHRGEFDTITALKELFVYAVKYNSEIMNTLQMDITNHQSVNKFGNLINYKF